VSFIAITSSGRKRKISRAAAAGKKVEKSCFFCRGPDFSSSLRERERERGLFFILSLFLFYENQRVLSPFCHATKPASSQSGWRVRGRVKEKERERERREGEKERA
jgi:hypothetical protein